MTTKDNLSTLRQRIRDKIDRAEHTLYGDESALSDKNAIATICEALRLIPSAMFELESLITETEERTTQKIRDSHNNLPIE